MSTSTPPARRTQRSTPRAWACAALLAGAALLPLHPARANLDATCNTVAEIFLEDLAATDSGVSAAGCDAAGASAYSICGSRGNAGTCASVSACDDAVDKVISDATALCLSLTADPFTPTLRSKSAASPFHVQDNAMSTGQVG